MRAVLIARTLSIAVAACAALGCHARSGETSGAPAAAMPPPPPPPPAAPAAAAPPAAAAVAPPTASEMVQTASAALADCPTADAPAVPDGAHASLQEMMSARAAFQAYDTATNAYTQCVDAAVENTAQRYAGVASANDVKTLRDFGARAHNVAIDQEQAAADRMNVQVRTYKAAHPKS